MRRLTKHNLLTLACVLMLLIVSVPEAYSYFSTYTKTSGSKKIRLSDSEHFEEEVDGNIKTIKIIADEGSDPIFVRVKAFAPEPITLEYSGDSWALGDDDYYYYGKPIKDKEFTADLKIEIKNAPSDAQIDDEFHVVVIYESIPASVDKDGELVADWEHTEIKYLGQEEITSGTGNTEGGN